MKKKTGLVIAAVGVLAAMAASLSFASAAPTHKNAWGLPFTRQALSRTSVAQAPAITTAQTIFVISRGGHAQNIDLPPSGESQGDRVIVHTPLFDRTGQAVGEFNVEEVITKLTGNGEEQAVTTARLFGQGEITAQGDDTNQTTITLAVTGGTGSYQNARGEVRVTFLAKSVLMTYHLIP